jgi:hypothetical protein
MLGESSCPDRSGTAAVRVVLKVPLQTLVTLLSHARSNLMSACAGAALCARPAAGTPSPALRPGPSYRARCRTGYRLCCHPGASSAGLAGTAGARTLIPVRRDPGLLAWCARPLAAAVPDMRQLADTGRQCAAARLGRQPADCHPRVSLGRAAELFHGAGLGLAGRVVHRPGDCAPLTGQRHLVLTVAGPGHRRHSRARTGGGTG